jgi:hypothetical protein
MVIDSQIDRVIRNFGKLERKKREKLRGLLELSKRHSHACSEAVSLFPVYSMMMAILSEQNESLNLLENELLDISEKIELQPKNSNKE